MRHPRAFQTLQTHARDSGGESAYFHVISRVAGRELLFGDQEKEQFRKLLGKQLKFSGLRAIAWCFMGNHFHLLLEVPDKETALEGWSEEDVLGRLTVLSDELSTKMLLSQLAIYKRSGYQEGIAEIAEGVRRRLFDLSAFMKELKQRFTGWFNRCHGRVGTLWEGRFKSVLLEKGEAVRMVAAYIDLNPVRAGLCENPEDYRWCSYAAAAAGGAEARRGLARAFERVKWTAKLAGDYRMILFGQGQEVIGGATPLGYVPPKRGFARERPRNEQKLWTRAVGACQVEFC